VDSNSSKIKDPNAPLVQFISFHPSRLRHVRKIIIKILRLDVDIEEDGIGLD
jgi:hypothetical protein